MNDVLFTRENVPVFLGNLIVPLWNIAMITVVERPTVREEGYYTEVWFTDGSASRYCTFTIEQAYQKLDSAYQRTINNR